MATITIEINEKSPEATDFIAYLLSLLKQKPFVKIGKIPNRATKNAIIEARKGKNKVMAIDELFDSI